LTSPNLLDLQPTMAEAEEKSAPLPVSNEAKYVAEFVGTFMLIFAVGNNVLGGSAVWGATSIACTLMVSIYALADISGANFNPAVSCALGFAGKMDWNTVSCYVGVQMMAGFFAAVAYGLLHWKVFDIGPATGYYWYHAAFAEFIYTFMLCFVVLNCAASKMDGGKNQYYGLAIGFVIVAGGYGAGHISGGCFNPAVAFGIDISSAALGFGWCFVYTIFEILGAYAAASLFQIIRPEETDPEDEPPRKYKIGSRMVSEFIGTYMLVLTVGLNVLGGSTAPAFSIAAALMCMIFSLGSVSGAHFNPAVTMAIVATGRTGSFTSQNGEQYIVLQVAGGVLGAFSYAFLENGKTFPLNPGVGHSWFEACTAETVYTFFLCYVVLCVATVKEPKCSQVFGLVIGACVTTGGYAIGALSGGSLNPAVSIGISTSHILGGGNFWHCLVYSLFEVIGGLLAAGLFRVTHPGEFEVDKALS